MMDKKIKKCKVSGCGNWTVRHGVDYCEEHRHKLDPISALYIDKTPEELEADEHVIEFFSYLLTNKSPEELLS